jgi:hypothetical protein
MLYRSQYGDQGNQYQVHSEALHFLMPLPTLFFTLITYAIHEVTYVTAPLSRGEIKATISFACTAKQ